MAGFTLCADFGMFPDDHRLGPVFVLSGFNFIQASGPEMFVNETDGERGLQLPNDGVEILLPTAIESVLMRIGCFASEAEVMAFDVAGSEVWRRSMPAWNRYVDISITGTALVMIRITGGGNEALIQRICATLC